MGQDQLNWDEVALSEFKPQIFEQQFSIKCFQDLIEKKVHENRPCVLESFKLGEDVFYLDHIEYGDSRIVSKGEADHIFLNMLKIETDETGKVVKKKIVRDTIQVCLHRIQLHQNIKVYLVSKRQLEESGNDPSSNMISIEDIGVHLNLSVDVSDVGISSLYWNVAEISSPYIPEGIKNDLVTSLQPYLQGSFPISLGFNNFGGAIPIVLNAGCSLDANGLSVAFRFETYNLPDQLFAGSTDPNWNFLTPVHYVIFSSEFYWTSFYRGTFGRYVSDGEIAIKCPSEYLLDSMLSTIKTGLKNNANFSLNSHGGPFGSYNPVGGSNGVPVFNINFTGDVIIPHAKDIGGTFYITLELSLATTNVLHVRLLLDDDLNNIDCFIDILEAGAIFTLMCGAFLGLAAIIVCAVYLGSDIHLGAVGLPEEWTKKSSNEYYKDIKFSNSIDGNDFQLSKVWGVGNDLIFAGSLSIHDTSSSSPALKVEYVNPFEFCYDRPCSDDANDQSADSTICLSAEYLQLINIGEVNILDDPLKIFSIDSWPHTVSLDHPGLIQMRILKRLNQEYESAPYPCKVLILSTGGARIITLPEVEDLPIKSEMTESEYNQFEYNRIIFCWRPVYILKRLGIIFHDWIMEPIPYEGVGICQWDIFLMGLNRNDFVALFSNKENEIMTTSSDYLGKAYLSAFLESEDYGRQISISVNGKQLNKSQYERLAKDIQIPKHKPDASISIRQRFLVKESSIQLDARSLNLRLHIFNGFPILKVETEIGAAYYNLSDFSRPQRMSGFIESEVLKVLSKHQGGTNDDLNFHRISLLGRSVADFISRELSNHERTDKQKIIALSKSVILRKGDEIVVYDTSDPESPVKAVVFNVGYKGHVTQAKIPGFPHAIFIQTGVSSGKAIDFSDPFKPKIVARYKQLPWFVGYASLKNLFVKLSDDGDMVNIFHILAEGPGVPQPSFKRRKRVPLKT